MSLLVRWALFGSLLLLCTVQIGGVKLTAKRDPVQWPFAGRFKKTASTTTGQKTTNEPVLLEEEKPSGFGKVLAAIGMPKKTGKCMGLVKKMCKACPYGGDPKICKSLDDECASTFCLPLCRRITWTCEVSFGKLKLEAANPQYEQGLCSQFMAAGCQKMMKCCPLDQYLYDYIDNYAFFDQYPDPRFPSPFCLEGPSPKLCSQCKAAVKVKTIKGVCPFPTMAGNKDLPKAKGKSFLEEDASAQSHQSGTRRSSVNTAVLQRMGVLRSELGATSVQREKGGPAPGQMTGSMAVGLTSQASTDKKKDKSAHVATAPKANPAAAAKAMSPQAAFNAYFPGMQESSVGPMSRMDAREVEYWLKKDRDWHKRAYQQFMQVMDKTGGPGGAEKGGAKTGPKSPCGMGPGGFAGCPAHTSMEDRCEALLKKVKAKLPSMKSKFQNKVCACMGCCEGGCYYPVQAKFKPGGEEKG